ncbi:unnamed protein product [Periconia digitata]|uniref:Uncharacterized protein n=1 Tax=Periconia digitata TaxID=1303443 RepID=A0A9W4XFB7_9PLEO|nr:unnamed protein product [Periconia digitata]
MSDSFKICTTRRLLVGLLAYLPHQHIPPRSINPGHLLSPRILCYPFINNKERKEGRKIWILLPYRSE